jgi:peptidoglycan/LPS O-acetylase OafA/YrhL
VPADLDRPPAPSAKGPPQKAANVILVGLITGAHLADFFWHALHGTVHVGALVLGMLGFIGIAVVGGEDEEGQGS